MKIQTAPAKFPAEWEPQDAIILAWPTVDTDWQPILPEIRHTYLELIKHITRFESVVLLLPDQAAYNELLVSFNDILLDPDRVVPVFTPYNDTWLRDSGPLSIQMADSLKCLDFRFNGWGGKFEYSLDDKICEHLFKHDRFKHIPIQSLDVILEGGSIDTDGHGTLLTTTQCLLNENRNPQLSKDDYEQLFSQTLGIRKVHWLEHGSIIGDDTDGHIDMLARFCTRNIIVYCSCTDQNDPHYLPLNMMAEELKSFTDLDGKHYTLIDLPIPEAIRDIEGDRLPASYCNFLIINNAVLVPVYDDEMDEVACEKLADIFTDREIIPVNAKSIIKQGGSLHCLTMQIPAD